METREITRAFRREQWDQFENITQGKEWSFTPFLHHFKAKDWMALCQYWLNDSRIRGPINDEVEMTALTMLGDGLMQEGLALWARHVFALMPESPKSTRKRRRAEEAYAEQIGEITHAIDYEKHYRQACLDGMPQQNDEKSLRRQVKHLFYLQQYEEVLALYDANKALQNLKVANDQRFFTALRWRVELRLGMLAKDPALRPEEGDDAFVLWACMEHACLTEQWDAALLASRLLGELPLYDAEYWYRAQLDTWLNIANKESEEALLLWLLNEQLPLQFTAFYDIDPTITFQKTHAEVIAVWQDSESAALRRKKNSRLKNEDRWTVLSAGLAENYEESEKALSQWRENDRLADYHILKLWLLQKAGDRGQLRQAIGEAIRNHPHDSHILAFSMQYERQGLEAFDDFQELKEQGLAHCLQPQAYDGLCDTLRSEGLEEELHEVLLCMAQQNHLEVYEDELLALENKEDVDGDLEQKKRKNVNWIWAALVIALIITVILYLFIR